MGRGLKLGDPRVQPNPSRPTSGGSLIGGWVAGWAGPVPWVGRRLGERPNHEIRSREVGGAPSWALPGMGTELPRSGAKFPKAGGGECHRFPGGVGWLAGPGWDRRYPNLGGAGWASSPAPHRSPVEPCRLAVTAGARSVLDGQAGGLSVAEVVVNEDHRVARPVKKAGSDAGAVADAAVDPELLVWQLVHSLG